MARTPIGWQLPSGQRAKSRAQALRDALREGAMGPGELSKVTGIPSRLIAGFLKVDLATGRVKHTPGLYELVAHFDGDLNAQIQDARRLLKANGYEVVRRDMNP